MGRTSLLLLCLLSVLAVGLAQNYRCDWSVVGIGGGEMSSGAYKCVATAGQTAAGFMTSPSYRALVGFWLPEGQEGVQDQTQLPGQGPLVTRLYAPKPNPFRAALTIRYSLAAEGRVTLRVHDLTGRVVRTLADNVMRPGRYSLSWNGTDDRGMELARGVYFCRLSAGDHRATEKVVLQK